MVAIRNLPLSRARKLGLPLDPITSAIRTPHVPAFICTLRCNSKGLHILVQSLKSLLYNGRLVAPHPQCKFCCQLEYYFEA